MLSIHVVEQFQTGAWHIFKMRLQSRADFLCLAQNSI